MLVLYIYTCLLRAELNKLGNKNSIHGMRYIYIHVCACIMYCAYTIRMSSLSCGGGGGRLRRVPVDSPRVICLIVLRFFNHCPRHTDGKLFPAPAAVASPGHRIKHCIKHICTINTIDRARVRTILYTREHVPLWRWFYPLVVRMVKGRGGKGYDTVGYSVGACECVFAV